MTEQKQLLKVIEMPEAGQGITLCFRNRDLVNLQTDLGHDFIVASMENLDRHRMDWVEAYLKHGGKKDGKPHQISLDAFDDGPPLVEIEKRILDALFLSVHGRKLEDHLRYLIEKQKQAKDEQNDEDEVEDGERPLASSTPSSGSVTEPE